MCRFVPGKVEPTVMLSTTFSRSFKMELRMFASSGPMPAETAQWGETTNRNMQHHHSHTFPWELYQSHGKRVVTRGKWWWGEVGVILSKTRSIATCARDEHTHSMFLYDIQHTEADNMSIKQRHTRLEERPHEQVRGLPKISQTSTVGEGNMLMFPFYNFLLRWRWYERIQSTQSNTPQFVIEWMAISLPIEHCSFDVPIAFKSSGCLS